MQYQQTKPQEKVIPYQVPPMPKEMAGADTFFVKKETCQCIVDYYSTFPIVRRADSLTADDLVKAANIIFTKF